MFLAFNGDDNKGERQWITISGAHVPLDEDGTLGGQIGEKINGSYFTSAHKYFQEHLQGKVIERKIDGEVMEIHFNRLVTWEKFKDDMKKDTWIKEHLLPYVAGVIAYGQHSVEAVKSNHPDVSQFHIFKKNQKYDGKEYEIKVAVMERPKKIPKYLAYSFIKKIVQPVNNEKIKRSNFQSTESGGDCLFNRGLPQPCKSRTLDIRTIKFNRCGNSVRKIYEVVNIEIEKTFDQIILDAQNAILQAKKLLTRRTF